MLLVLDVLLVLGVERFSLEAMVKNLRRSGKVFLFAQRSWRCRSSDGFPNEAASICGAHDETTGLALRRLSALLARTYSTSKQRTSSFLLSLRRVEGCGEVHTVHRASVY